MKLAMSETTIGHLVLKWKKANEKKLTREDTQIKDNEKRKLTKVSCSRKRSSRIFYNFD